jgi:CubicO group peptidase (beta-lactamase class C family)
VTIDLGDVDALLREHRVAGVGVAVIEDGAIVQEQAWGVKDTATAEPVTTATLFQAGSISKPVACFGGLRLVEAGLIDLDGDVNDRLTSWSVPAVGGWQPRLTPRMLMTHLAGLTTPGFPGYRVDELVDVLDVLEGRGNTPAVRVDGVPGISWRYSGGGTTVLQQLMADVGGGPFADLMRRLVLEPAGMTQSTYEQPLPEACHPEAATGHNDLEPWPTRWDSFAELAAAGLWATPADLARFCLAVAASHAGAPGALLGSAATQELLTGQAQAPGMGLGPVLSTAGPLVFSHDGGQWAGFTCSMACTADGSLGAVAMTNSGEGPAVAHELLRRVGATRGVELPPSADWRLGDEDADAPLASGAAVPGAYVLGDLELTVAVEGDGLTVTFGPQPPLRFRLQDGEWRTPGLDTALGFDGDALTVRQFGRLWSAGRAALVE